MEVFVFLQDLGVILLKFFEKFLRKIYVLYSRFRVGDFLEVFTKSGFQSFLLYDIFRLPQRREAKQLKFDSCEPSHSQIIDDSVDIPNTQV